MNTETTDPSVGISVSLRETNLAKLRARAKRMERSVSWVLNHAAEEYLQRNPMPDTDAEAVYNLEKERAGRVVTK